MTSRRDEAVKLRNAGLSYAEIGRRLGMSRERARQIVEGKPARPKRKPALDLEAMLTIGDVARALNLHINTVRRWSNKGILKSYRIGLRGDRRFRQEDVDAFLRERQPKKLAREEDTIILSNDLGKILKQRRVMVPLTLQQLSERSGVSASHLGRVERGERFPSGTILRKIAKPLGSEESELLALAGDLSSQPSTQAERPSAGRLDPYVTAVLSRETVEVQRAMVTILSVMKSMAK